MSRHALACHATHRVPEEHCLAQVYIPLPHATSHHCFMQCAHFALLHFAISCLPHLPYRQKSPSTRAAAAAWPPLAWPLSSRMLILSSLCRGRLLLLVVAVAHQVQHQPGLALSQLTHALTSICCAACTPTWLCYACATPHTSCPSNKTQAGSGLGNSRPWKHATTEKWPAYARAHT